MPRTLLNAVAAWSAVALLGNVSATVFLHRALGSITTGIRPEQRVAVHRAHHAAPFSARLSHRWYEVDRRACVLSAVPSARLAAVQLGELRPAVSAAQARTRQPA